MSEIDGIIEREISYWIAKNHNYKQFFDKLKVIECILAIRFDLNKHPLKEKIITDFIKGNALTRHALIKKTEEYDTEIDRLVRPLFELMEQRRATPEYQDQIINAQITGESFILSNGVITPITAKAIKLHIRRLKASPWIPKDIEAIEKDFRNYTEGQYTTLAPNKAPRQIKDFRGYFAQEYKETLPEALKSEFTTEKGKGLRLMLIALEDAGFLTIGNQSEMYRAMKIFFGRNIGTYEGMFTVFKYVPDMHVKDLKNIEVRLKRVLAKIDKPSL